MKHNAEIKIEQQLFLFRLIINEGKYKALFF